MAEHNESVQEWWLAVRRIADLINLGGVRLEDDRAIRAQLNEFGFSADGIGKAMDWMDKAALSGNLVDSLGMLQPMVGGPRIDHILEQASVHPELLRALDACRKRAWLHQSTTERILEGLRTLDSLDWDKQEIDRFLIDILGVTAPILAGTTLSAILGRWSRQKYN